MSVSLTDEEIHEQAEFFLLTSAKNSNRSIHLPDEDSYPLCTVDASAEVIKRKETEVIPVGYYPICGPCKHRYEEEVA